MSQLSIPGTHDAATGDGTTFSLGKTQSLTLQEQWNMGIRMFDLRPGYDVGVQEGIIRKTMAARGLVKGRARSAGVGGI